MLLTFSCVLNLSCLLRPLISHPLGCGCEFQYPHLHLCVLRLLQHTLGWFGKAVILRDYWFCWILSVTFELAEYSLQHQLPNFNECWYVIVDKHRNKISLAHF